MPDTQTHKINQDLVEDFEENIRIFELLFRNCDDVVKKRFQIDEAANAWAYISYIDVLVDKTTIQESVLERITEEAKNLNKKLEASGNDLVDFLKNYVVASADVKEVNNFDEVCRAVLSGDTILMIEGFNKALVIATKAYPNRGIQEADTEVVVKGSKDSFSEVIRHNTVLIRRRIRDTRLKVRQYEIGTRSRTDVAVMYIEDIAREDVVREVETRFRQFEIDAILETGMLEEMLEPNWKSPFPKFLTTQRPDKVASLLLEGRVAIVVDNTPYVITVPTSITSFFQSSEDYYDNWYLSTLIRIIRYISAFMAVSVPGLYIALTNFHPSMIPTGLVFSIAGARSGVPFPGIIEVILLELAFELLREAGVRLPGAVGNTIGIVGGLIIGQAAVEANLVSPIIVIVVALTALASYAIPSYIMTGAYRVVKYWFIFWCSIFGLYGYWLAVIAILGHLVGLKSFGFPYMFPIVSDDINDYDDMKDTFFRLPLSLYKKRPFYTKKSGRTRLKLQKKK